MSKFAPSFRLILMAGATAGALAGASASQAQSVPSTAEADTKKAPDHVSNYIDLTGAVGFATNPRLVADGSSQSGSAGLGRVSINAVHAVQSDRDSIRLSAYAENQSYTNGTPSTQSFSLTGSISHVASPRLSVFGSASFSGDVGGQLYNRFIDVPTAPPVIDLGNPIPPGTIIDPTLVSLNRRSYRASVQGGLAYRLSDRDSVNATLGYDRVFFTGGNELDYNSVNGSLGWDRALSERTSAGLRVSASRSDYGSRGHSTVVSPQVTAHTQLAEGWVASGAVGLSFVDQQTPLVNGKSTSLSFNASLCKNSPNEAICANASRGSQTSVGFGLTTATSASLSYFRRLNAKETIQASLSATRTSDGGLLAVGPTTYYSAGASYNRTISPRLSAGADLSVRKVDQRNASIGTDGSATIYLRYRLGDLL